MDLKVFTGDYQSTSVGSSHSSPSSPLLGIGGVYFYWGDSMTLNAALVMDYQNVHLTGHEVFGASGDMLHHNLIEPSRFAMQLATKRNSTQPDSSTHITFGQVDVYRGLPDSEFDPLDNARNLSQRESWEKHPKVRVIHRPLKYGFHRGDDGEKLRNHEGRLQPNGEKEEKGIDVLCALAMMRHANSGIYDVVILASVDTDLTPALDEASKLRKSKIEACKWFDAGVRRTKGSHKTERSIWTTSMGHTCFTRSLDQRNYT